jgi:hypothetical protein
MDKGGLKRHLDLGNSAISLKEPLHCSITVYAVVVRLG